MTAHIIPLPRSLYVSEQDNAYGFEPVAELPRLPVEQDGGRVLIYGQRARTFVSETNAIRSVQLLRDLAALGWPIERLAQ